MKMTFFASSSLNSCQKPVQYVAGPTAMTEERASTMKKMDKKCNEFKKRYDLKVTLTVN